RAMYSHVPGGEGQLIGQRQDGQPRAIRSESQLATVDGGNLRYGEKIGASARSWRGVEYRPASLLAEARAEEPRSRRKGCNFRVREHGALFQASEILRSRDDLLTRVAALLEAYAVERVQVQRLRNELILCRRKDHRHAGADEQPSPAGKPGRPRRCCKTVPKPDCGLRSDERNEACAGNLQQPA